MKLNPCVCLKFLNTQVQEFAIMLVPSKTSLHVPPIDIKFLGVDPGDLKRVSFSTCLNGSIMLSDGDQNMQGELLQLLAYITSISFETQISWKTIISFGAIQPNSLMCCVNTKILFIYFEHAFPWIQLEVMTQSYNFV